MLGHCLILHVLKYLPFPHTLISLRPWIFVGAIYVLRPWEKSLHLTMKKLRGGSYQIQSINILDNIKIKEYDYSSPLIIECEHKLAPMYLVGAILLTVSMIWNMKASFLSHLKFYLVNYLIWKIAQWNCIACFYIYISAHTDASFLILFQVQ